VAPDRLRAALDPEATPDAELARARDEFRTLVGIGRDALPVVAAVVGARNAGDDLLRVPPKEAAGLARLGLCLWVAVRRVPAYRDLYRALAAAAPVADALRRAIEAGPSPGARPGAEAPPGSGQGRALA
jgi:hypothetical protein